MPFLPILSHFIHEKYVFTYEEWMQYDFEWLQSCDVVLRLSGISDGAEREVLHAINYDIPVFFDVNDLINHFKCKGE